MLTSSGEGTCLLCIFVIKVPSEGSPHGRFPILPEDVFIAQRKHILRYGEDLDLGTWETMRFILIFVGVEYSTFDYWYLGIKVITGITSSVGLAIIPLYLLEPIVPAIK